MVKVHVVDLKAESVAAPITVRAYLNENSYRVQTAYFKGKF